MKKAKCGLKISSAFTCNAYDWNCEKCLKLHKDIMKFDSDKISDIIQGFARLEDLKRSVRQNERAVKIIKRYLNEK